MSPQLAIFAVPLIVAPIAAQASDAVVGGDLATALLQLGIGGILVVFGATIYRRFEGRADKATERHAEEIRALQLAFDQRLQLSEDRHDETRRLLFEALRTPALLPPPTR